MRGFVGLLAGCLLVLLAGLSCVQKYGTLLHVCNMLKITVLDFLFKNV